MQVIILLIAAVAHCSVLYLVLVLQLHTVQYCTLSLCCSCTLCSTVPCPYAAVAHCAVLYLVLVLLLHTVQYCTVSLCCCCTLCSTVPCPCAAVAHCAVLYLLDVELSSLEFYVTRRKVEVEESLANFIRKKLRKIGKQTNDLRR